MASLAPSPTGQYYRRHIGLGPWRAAQEAAARDAGEMSVSCGHVSSFRPAPRLQNSLALLKVATNATIGRLIGGPGLLRRPRRFRDFRHVQ